MWIQGEHNKEWGFGARSLTYSTSGVEGHVGAPR
jgi:hypothetical protein